MADEDVIDEKVPGTVDDEDKALNDPPADDGAGDGEGEEHESAGEDGKPEGDEPPTSEISITLGDTPLDDENPDDAAPSWVREVRAQNRELKRKLRELETKQQQTQSAPALGEKPTLESVDYDTDKYEAEVAKWYERKRAHDAEADKRRQQEETQAKQWQGRVDAYTKARLEMAARVPDYDEAEARVQDTLSATQQAVLVQGAANPALVVYALGKHASKAKELSAIADPVKFAFAVATLEAQLKVTQKKSPPPPESTVKGGRVAPSGSSAKLEKLREQAGRTGNYDEYLRYKRSLKSA
jgi:hypothetical protein